MMDFGAVGFESLVGPHNGVSSQAVVSHPETTKTNGSGFLKQERSRSGEQDWRGSKMAKINDSDAPKTMLHHKEPPLLLRSNSLLSIDGGQHQNMLSFSSPGSEVQFLSQNGGLVAERRSNHNPPLPYYQHSAYGYNRNAGYGSSGGLNTAGMHVPVLGARGPFTPSQWVELEHQALIYKYIVANVPVPTNLLMALQKPNNPYGLSGFSSGSYTPNSCYSGNTDPEPGRCRRTDGKKWRCSKDAVPEQKYCERHINRGRHRSRKPVEGRSGQAVSGSTTAMVAPPVVCSSSAASVMSSSGMSNSLGVAQHPIKGSLPGAKNTSAAAVLVNRMQDPQGLSVVSPTTNLKSKDSPFSIPKQHMPISESSQSEFGVVSFDSLLNPSHKSSFMNSENYNSVLDFNNPQSQDQHPLRLFFDDWPKDQSDRATIAWPEELKSDWTQLSMSIPMATSDFSSTSSSSPRDKIPLSPLRLSSELDLIKMGLAVHNNHHSESTQKQTNLVPISWGGNSMGGPLGEVLNSGSGSVGASKSLTGVWNGSPQVGSSPTGVLQKTTFVSLSNSSSASSPRAEKVKNNESGSLGDDFLGSTLASSFSAPYL